MLQLRYDATLPNARVVGTGAKRVRAKMIGISELISQATSRIFGSKGTRERTLRGATPASHQHGVGETIRWWLLLEGPLFAQSGARWSQSAHVSGLS